MAYEFHYTPAGTGVISGKEVLEQTEDAINDLGNTAISGVQEALDKAEQALTNSANAVDDAQTALNTANNAEGVAIQAQNDVSNLSETVTNLGNRVTTDEGNITNLQGRMTTAEGNIGNLQTAVSTAQATANSAQQTATTARQQSYVLRYSSTTLVASSTNSNSLLDNTDNLKVGDKVIDSSGVIYSVTTIDTANSTFTIGTALIDLAQDSDVVHKTGDESITGTKTFGNGTLIVNNGVGSNVHGEIKLNGSRPVYINADNSADGLFANTACGMSILLDSSSKSIHIGGVTTGDNGRKIIKTSEKAPYLTLGTQEVRTQILVPENDTADSTFSITSTLNYASGASAKSFAVKFRQSDNGSSGVFPVSNNKTDLGLSGNRWKNVYATNYYYGNDNVEFSTKFVTTDTNQTIGGVKTFTDNNMIKTSSPKVVLVNTSQTGNTAPSSNSASFLRFDGGTVNNFGGVQFEFLTTSENRLTNYVKDITTARVNSIQQRANSTTAMTVFNADLIIPSLDGVTALGSSSKRWSDVQTYKVNALEPSALSLPSQTYVDISSYFTNTGTGEYNTYTAPSNGWIFLRLDSISSCQAQVLDSSDNLLWGTSSSGSLEMITIPILSGCKLQTQWATGSVVNVAIARFIPCQGNV